MTTAATPAGLFAHILARNPFTDNRVNAPSDNDVDVADLHRIPFERLTALAREALVEGRGIGVMLWGEAGVGKSHLLSRLIRWSRDQGSACSVYLHNLQAGPAELPRVLQRSVVGNLTWTESTGHSGTRLFRMIDTAVRRAVGNAAGKQPWPYLRQRLLHLLGGTTFTGPSDAGLSDQRVNDVLFRFYRSVLRNRLGREDGRTARLAVQWLRGDGVPADEARTMLDLPPGRLPDAPVAVEDAQQIKQILAALTRLAAACNMPFVLCFDQVDNLEESQASALARFLEGLIDSSRNLLVVTAGNQDALRAWQQRRLIQESAWDRLAQVQLELLRLSPRQARQLLEARLRHFFAPFEEVPEVRLRLYDDSLFPLGARWFEKQMGDAADARPREILNAAREAWYRERTWLEQQGGPAWLAGWKQRQTDPEGQHPPAPLGRAELDDLIDRTVAERMAEHSSALHGHAPDRNSLAEAVGQLLEECRRLDPETALVRVLRPEEVSRELAKTYHLFLDHRTEDGLRVRTGLVITAGAAPHSAATLLDRLREDPNPPPRLLLLADETGPGTGADAENSLKQLRQRSSSVVELLSVPASELIALDALSATWNLARSEDLETTLPDGKRRAVTPEEVMESHRRQGRFAASKVLQALLATPARPVVGEVTAPVGPSLSLDDATADPVMSEDEAVDALLADDSTAAVPVSEQELDELIRSVEASAVEAEAAPEEADDALLIDEEITEADVEEEPIPEAVSEEAEAEAEQDAIDYLLGEPEPALAPEQEAEAVEEIEVSEDAVVVEEDESEALFDDPPPAKKKSR